MENIIRFELRDKDSNELISVSETQNILTVLGQSAFHNLDSIRIAGTTAAAIRLYTDITIPGNPALTQITSDAARYFIPDSEEQPWTVFSGAVPYIETKYRFQPPSLGITRQINTVALTNNLAVTLSHNLLAYASLNGTCTQTDSQVLDVFYRIQIFPPASSLSNGAASNNFQNIYANTLFNTLSAINVHDIKMSLNKLSPAITKPPINSLYDWVNVSGIVSAGTNFSNKFIRDAAPNSSSRLTGWEFPYYEDYDMNVSYSEGSGTPIRSFAQGGSFFQDLGFSWFDSMPSSIWPNQPIQVVHGHSVNSDKPFVDIDNLPTSQGGLAISGGTWTETECTDWNRIDITITGQVGVSRYVFSDTKISGFTDVYDGYYPIPMTIMGLATLYDTNVPVIDSFAFCESTTSHRPWDNTNATDYIDGLHVIHHDSSGIQFTSIIDNEFFIFDTLTSPSLPCTNIRQVTVTPDGTVFVADSTTGLWKITDPLGTPVIARQTNVNAGIDDSKCYAVCEGYSGAVWAVFEGALSKTENSGTTWVDYNESNLSFRHNSPSESSISVNNTWNKIDMITADTGMESGIIVFVYKGLTTTGTFFIWEESLGNTHRDVSYTSLYLQNGTDKYRLNKSAVKASRGKSIWSIARNDEVRAYDSVSSFVDSFTYRSFQQGTTSVYTSDDGSYVAGFTPTFFYSFDGTPYPVCSTYQYLSYQAPVVESIYGTQTVIAMDTRQNTVVFIPYVSFERAGSNTYLAITSNTGSTVGNGLACYASFLGTAQYSNYSLTAGVPLTDNWMGKNLPNRSFMWNEWRYNPVSTNFELGFHQDLTDTVSTNHGTRRGFNVESNTYRGRSTVSLPLVGVGKIDGSYTMVMSFTIDTKDYPTYRTTKHTLLGTKHVNIGYNSSTLSIFARFSHVYDKSATQVHTKSATVTLLPTNRLVVANTLLSPSGIDIAQSINNVTSASYTTYNAIPSLTGIDFVNTLLAGTTTTRIFSAILPQYTEAANGDFRMNFKINRYGRPSQVGFGFALGYSGVTLDSNVSGYFNANSTELLHMFHIGSNTNTLYHSIVNLQNASTVIPLTNSLETNDYNGTNELELRALHSTNSITYTLTRLTGNVVIFTLVKSAIGHNNLPMTPILTFMSINSADYIGCSINDLKIYDNITDVTKKSTAVYSTDVYLNDVLILSNYKQALENVKNGVITKTALDNEIIIGATNDRIQDLHLFGTIDNVQAWTSVWTQTEVTEDFSNISGTIANTGTLLSRYTTTSLAGLESKLTHVAIEALPNGTTIGFTNGDISPAFVATDFYNYAVMNGMMKDNATTFDMDYRQYFNPVDFSYSDLEHNQTLITTVPSGSTSIVVDEPVLFTKMSEVDEYGVWLTKYVGSTILLHGCRSWQLLNADFDMSFRTVSAKSTTRMFVSTLIEGNPNQSLTINNVSGVQFNADSTTSYYINAVLVGSGTYIAGDTFRISRIGTVFTIRKNDVVEFSNTSSNSTMQLYFYAHGNDSPAISDVLLSFTRQHMAIELGNSTDNTGKYHPNYVAFDNKINLWTITIGGVPAVILMGTDPNSSFVPVLGANEVYVVPKLGLIYTDATASAKTIVVNAPVVTYK